MRVIGGSLKGRRIPFNISKWPTRPTTDRAKEGLFNILENRYDFREIQMLDLFAGTGSMGIEALSRGAMVVHAVEQYRQARRSILDFVKDVGVDERYVLHGVSIKTFFQSSRQLPIFDIVFADPPYFYADYDSLVLNVLHAHFFAQNSLLIIEHDHRWHPKDIPNKVDERVYGQSRFSFFQH